MDWHPWKFFGPEKPPNPYALILLNVPLNVNAYDVVVKNAKIIVCADGGANRLYEIGPTSKNLTPRKLPNAVIGDLDSLKPEVDQHFRDQGVEIVHDPDQYSTDFTKCLKWLRQHGPSSAKTHDQPLDVVALGSLSGRVDQGLSQIHHLYMVIQNLDDDLLLHHGSQIFLLSEQSISFVLARGENTIQVNIVGEVFAGNVGILPVGCPAVISTRGLEWDVQGWKTAFGGQVSTSNHLRSTSIEVATDQHVLLTLELAGRLCSGS